MSILPSVHAHLAERFILNFRMPPEQMRRFLPVDWLEPAEIDGHAIASFCVLDLRNITVRPMPASVGLSSMSCAPRYAVVDRSVDPPTPAVYVTERYTNSAFGSWFTGLGFSAPHPHVDVTVTKESGETRFVIESGGSELCSAVLRATSDLRDSVFSPASFKAFVAQGVSSYGRSIHGARLTRVNLYKQDDSYEPLVVVRCSGAAIDEWLAAGAVLDSAFRTSNGKYEWEYLGLTS